MLPWGHAALGYLLYSGWLRLRSRGPPTGAAAVGLALGTQFPDLVDKPLSWTVGLLPSGRSLGHSLVVLVPVTVVVLLLVRRWFAAADGGGSAGSGDGTPAVGAGGAVPPADAQPLSAARSVAAEAPTRVAALAFLAGWYAHLLGDALPPLLEADCLSFLLWPLRPVCPYDETDRSIVGFFVGLELSTALLLGAGLTVVAAILWLVDGAPGYRWCLDRLRR